MDVTALDWITLGIAAGGSALACLSLGWQAATFVLSGERVREYPTTEAEEEEGAVRRPQTMTTLLVVLMALTLGLAAGGLLLLARWRGEVALRRETQRRPREALRPLTSSRTIIHEAPMPKAGDEAPLPSRLV
jgi:hypothetical protein